MDGLQFAKPDPTKGHLWPRFIVLRLIGVWFFSAFYSLDSQIRGLIGEHGILPCNETLRELATQLGLARYWAAPTLLWIWSSDRALTYLWIAGMVASVALVLNLWPKAAVAIATVFFLSFIAVGRAFASYQSDGMLLSAGFCAFFFAPAGIAPGLGQRDPPSRISLFALQWLWFCVYFGSGVVKVLSGDEQWRNLTAMDHYYENGPLPAWPGWYVQELLPHWFHAATAAATLALELVFSFLLFLPRRAGLTLFFVATSFQVGIILTANYAFLNYLILTLGILLLDDAAFARIGLTVTRSASTGEGRKPPWQRVAAVLALAVYFYVSGFLLLSRVFPFLRRLPEAPVTALEPFRIANAYGLFAVMTRARYEIEFQGSADGVSWTPYLFRYKPQALDQAPGIYAPYQPRFEWNLWFASLADWRRDPWVLQTEARLLEGVPSVLALFEDDPFGGKPPRQVRTVRYQYWFTTPQERRATGNWWRREALGPYAPALQRDQSGRIERVP
jgi:lipase maturation factor 1